MFGLNDCIDPPLTLKCVLLSETCEVISRIVPVGYIQTKFNERVYMTKFSEDFSLIPVSKHSIEEKDEQDRIMRRGNKVFRQYHERIKAKIEGTGNGRYGRQKFHKELFDAVKADAKNIIVRGVSISQTDFSLIKKVKDIEFQILSTYSRLFYKMAKAWSAIDASMSFEDYYNEIVIAAIVAIYGFVKEDIKFSTYLVWVIKNKMLNVSNENKPLSAWTQDNKKLYGDFERTCQSTGKEIGFEEIVKLMELNEKQTFDLRSMLTKVITQTELSREEKDENTSFGIYSAEQRVSTPVIDYDQMAMIRNVPMTDWERTVFEAYLSGSRGWASEVARSNINPKTDEPYSRRAPKITLDRILEKIKENIAA